MFIIRKKNDRRIKKTLLNDLMKKLIFISNLFEIRYNENDNQIII